MTIPVNFEIAKLIKEKGFDEKCKFYWSSDTNEIEEFLYYQTDRNYSKYTGYPEDVLYFVPTIAEVVMWLYEKYGIWMYVFRHDFNNNFYWHIDTLHEDEFTSDVNFNSPTEAYEAAILYTLNNLI